ncbi:MAG: ABC transporter substrate-binding protein [Elusimicrobia bacterium]|nr:ABC transporter substrate-binding protein [Elusimicrobiota bacterium]
MKYVTALFVAGMLSAQLAWSGERSALAELTAAGGMTKDVSAPLPGAPEKVAPDVMVRTMTDEVLKIIKTAPKDEVIALLLPNFNFEHMTKIAAGKYWAPATEEQQKALVKEFRTLLVRTYSTALDMAAAGSVIEVKPLGPQPATGEALVKTVARQPGQPPITIDYRMESAGETWQVFDVIIDGVSLVTNYRSQFASVIAKSGVDGLIKLLAEKNSKQ